MRGAGGGRWWMGGWGGREGIVEGVRGAREGVERGDQQHPAALCCPPLQQPQLLSSSHRSNSGSTKNTKKRTNTKCYFAAESSRKRQIHQTALSPFSNSHRKAGSAKRHSSSKWQIHCIRVPVGKEFNPCIRMTALIYKPIYIMTFIHQEENMFIRYFLQWRIICL